MQRVLRIFEGVRMALDPNFGVYKFRSNSRWPGLAIFKELANKLIDLSLTGPASDAIILWKDTATIDQWNMFIQNLLKIHVAAF